MQGIYPVQLNNSIVGEAKIDIRGLYYDINCRCKLPHSTAYRLYIRSNTGTVDLGVLVPEQGEYVVRTKIAAKRLSHNDIAFCVLSPKCLRQDRSASINPAEPFSYLSQLEQLRLKKQIDGTFAVQQNKDVQSPETV